MRSHPRSDTQGMRPPSMSRMKRVCRFLWGRRKPQRPWTTLIQSIENPPRLFVPISAYRAHTTQYSATGEYEPWTRRGHLGLYYMTTVHKFPQTRSSRPGLTGPFPHGTGSSLCRQFIVATLARPKASKYTIVIVIIISVTAAQNHVRVSPSVRAPTQPNVLQ